MPIIITGVKKEGPIITCETNDFKGRTYRIDLNTYQAYGLNNRPIKRFSTITDKIPHEAYKKCNSILYLVHILCTTNDPEKRRIIESFFSYPDLLDHVDNALVQYLCKKYEGKIPKGFVAWCRENGGKITLERLLEFEKYKKLESFPVNLKKQLEAIKSGMGINLLTETEYNKELCVSLVQIINNSMKRYEIDCDLRIKRIIFILKNDPSLFSYLDTTKSANTALKILKTINDNKRNEAVLATEAKISKLNGMIIENFMIKIPSSQDDFIDEGKQQHNCVGSHYHDSIARGENLIYFLREPKCPNKSGVTCRFNIKAMKTVEHKTIYNREYDNPYLFKQIDTLICELLGL